MRINILTGLIVLLVSCDLSTKVENNEESLEDNFVEEVVGEKLKLTQSDLSVISSLIINNKAEYFEEDETINDYVKIELIDKELFEEKKSTSVDFLIADTNISRKKGDTLELKTKTGIKQYIDVPREFEEETKIHEYLGYVDFLNQYLILTGYYESYDYKLIDKINGELIQVLGGYPIITNDSNNIISLEDNPYESTTDLEVYTINNKQVNHKFSMSFKYWWPYEKFMSSDGYLYISVNHIKSYNWTEEGDVNNDYQYIRLKLI